MPLSLDRHPEDVGCALQEREIMLDELIFRSAVDLQHAEGSAISLQDDVYGAVIPCLTRISGVLKRSSISR